MAKPPSARPTIPPTLIASLLPLLACAPGAPEGQRSLVVFTVDTLRADQLGPYGGPAATPHLDRFARDARIFERAYTQATVTHPALTSMWTGLLPNQHGVHSQDARMHEGTASLPSLARAAGLSTASFVANLCKLQDHHGTVFHDGWQERGCAMLDDPADYRDQWEWDRLAVDQALAWLSSAPPGFLLWVHLMDPHAEHRPPPHLWDWVQRPPRERFEEYQHYNGIEARRERPEPEDLAFLWDLYRAEITGADEQFGRFLGHLDRRRDRRQIAVVFSSDHGEELFETWSRYDHGLSLTEGVLRIPLLVQAEGLAPGRENQVVELLQVAPTGAQWLGLSWPSMVSAPSLFDPHPSPGLAISSAGQYASTGRSLQFRHWRRPGKEAPTRDADSAPWRLDAPWFLERELLAQYSGPWSSLPTYLDLDLPQHQKAAKQHDHLRRTRAAAVRLAGPARSAVMDQGFAHQLHQLGYVGGD